MTAETGADWAELNRAQCSALLKRICESSELKRAARLRDFLGYVGQRALETENAQISEYEIGVQVFDRREGYDTGTDNIVRVNASELRKRIAAYYASEGAAETIQMEIPLRSYTPQFRPRIVEVIADATPAEPPQSGVTAEAGSSEPVAGASPQAPLPRYVAYVLCIVLAAVCAFLAYEKHSLENKLYGWRSEPTIGPFWTTIIDSPRQTDIILADTSFSLVEDALKKHISLSNYLNHNYLTEIQASSLSPEMKADLEVIATRNNGSLGDFRVAEKILAFDPLSSKVHLRYARDYSPSTLKTNNIVLIGSSHSNPWCNLFEDQLNFVLTYDADSNEMTVMNRHPGSGESAAYVTRVDPNSSNGYSVIDYIPNEDHTADVVIIAGTTSEATEAAGEFITSEESFHHVQEVLHAKRLPYFELLLKTTKLVGTPMSAQVIAYRTFTDGLTGAH